MPDTKTSDETAASALDGSELVRIVQGGNNRQTTAQDIADLAGVPAVPTIASTGFGTWLNQGGASVSDVATGMSLIAPSNGSTGTTILRGRTKAVPATPYTITAKFAVNALNVDYVWGGIGWYDGSAKLHVLEFYRSLSSPWSVDVRQWANTTSAGTVETNSTNALLPYGVPAWLRLRDDGTNVYFEFSVDGSNFITLYSVAKASGYLGSSGYSNLVLFTNAQTASAQVIATLMEYAET